MAEKDWGNPRALLTDWHERVRDAQHGHNESAKRFERRNEQLGVPVIVLTALIGTTVFATLQKEVDLRIKIAVGSISILATILSSLQTFKKYAERAERHHMSGIDYGTLRREMEQDLAVPEERLGADPSRTLGYFREKLDALSRNSPHVPPDIWRATMLKSKGRPPEKPPAPDAPR